MTHPCIKSPGLQLFYFINSTWRIVSVTLLKLAWFFSLTSKQSKQTNKQKENIHHGICLPHWYYTSHVTLKQCMYTVLYRESANKMHVLYRQSANKKQWSKKPTNISGPLVGAFLLKTDISENILLYILGFHINSEKSGFEYRQC